MRAFFTENDDLVIVVDRETADDLSAVSTLEELISTYLPKLERADRELLRLQTNAPVFTFGGEYWIYSKYLEADPIEVIRDEGQLTLEYVR